MIQSNAKLRKTEAVITKILLGLYKLFYRRKTTPAKPSGRILLCKTCCLGDAVLTLYAIRAFKFQYPEIELHVLASQRVEKVYSQSPFITTVHTLPLTGKNLARELCRPHFWITLFKTGIHLRRQHFSEYIDFELYRSYGSLVKLLLGIPFSRGFALDGAPSKHHDLEIFRPRNQPEWECFYNLMGLDIPSAKPEPIYSPPKSSKQLKKLGIVFGSSFNWPQKKWPREYFAETLNHFADDDFECILFGVDSEKTEGDWIAANSKSKIINTVGQLDLNALIQKLGDCDAVLGNDTGTMHVAAACGIPTFTLFGPTRPLKWNPLTSTPLYIDIPCRPCYYLGSMPDCSHFSCLRELKPKFVVEQIKMFFEKKSESY